MEQYLLRLIVPSEVAAFIEGVYTDKDCEHVTFHHDLKQKSNFNLFVNPSQTMLV